MSAERIPISAAKRIADDYGQAQVVLVTFSPAGVTHVVTYGRTVDECEQAARGGNFVKRALGWPESACHAVPARAKDRAFIEKIAKMACTHPYCDHQQHVLNKPRTSCAPCLARGYLVRSRGKR